VSAKRTLLWAINANSQLNLSPGMLAQRYEPPEGEQKNRKRLEHRTGQDLDRATRSDMSRMSTFSALRKSEDICSIPLADIVSTLVGPSEREIRWQSALGDPSLLCAVQGSLDDLHAASVFRNSLVNTANPACRHCDLRARASRGPPDTPV
jgi:hypothetical protein